jgi:hypothetical protein
MKNQAVVVLVFVVAFGVVHPALACSCSGVGAGSPDYREALQHADAVFRGTVLQVQDLRLPTDPPREGAFHPHRIVTFDADAAWAGPTSRRVFVFTGTGGGDCGFDFKVGRAYVVWATRSDWQTPGELSTGICTFTTALDDASDQLSQLGKPRKLKQ